MRRTRGFTLVEMLVVIVIIAILALLVVVLIKGMIDRSRNAATKALVDTLNKGCNDYKLDFGQFPDSASPGGSKSLHLYLGSPRILVKQYDSAGNPAITAKAPPLVEFRKDWLDPGAATTYPNPPMFVYCMWGKPVQYVNPGVNNPKSVDIWSKGNDDADAADDISNWIRDY